MQGDKAETQKNKKRPPSLVMKNGSLKKVFYRFANRLNISIPLSMSWSAAA